MSPRVRTSLWIFCSGLLVASILGIHEYRLGPDGHLHVYFLDVGQGDSALIVTPSGRQIIIDGGRDDSTLEHLGKLMPLSDRSIDLLILTHPQLDHIFAFPSILRRYSVERVLMTGVDYKLGRYREMLELLRKKNIPVTISDPAKDIDFGDGVTLDIVWPPAGLFGTSPKQVNDTSIVARLVYGTGSVLFTGDMEEKAEKELLATGTALRSTVLKVGHHGSKTSSGTGFLLAVAPRLAVISCSKDNTYGHPNPGILQRFKSLGIPVRVTAWEGTVEVTF